MLTDNYIKVLASYAAHGCIGELINTNGNVVDASKYVAYYMELQQVTHIATSKTDYGIVLGNGTSQPQGADYWLSGDLITNISSTISASRGVDENGSFQTVNCTITNNNDADIVISEIGYINGMNVGSYNSSGSMATTSVSGKFLLLHDLLDTPVTIPAGGVGQVTYTIRFNYPTA